MKATIIGVMLFAATGAAILFYPAADTTAKTPRETTTQITGIQNERPKVDVVFVLDTTGSMSGLIQAAKDKIWSTASTMASAQPTPHIRVGLVAYRDRGDEYVTRVIDLSDDLDSMYATLMDFRADGGGDTPESVNEALHDAIHEISWSQDPDSYRVVFLVGDAPPHMDYQNDVKFTDTVKVANARGIVVNTVQCGGHQATTYHWQQIARLGQGRYFQVNQSGSAIALATPYDAELARLSVELDDTRMYYGDREQREKMEEKVAATAKLHAESTEESRARRATFNASVAGERNLLGESELVEDVSSGRIDLDEVDAEALPEPMQHMSREEKSDYVARTARKRADLKRQIQALSEQRQSYISERIEETGGAGDSLDHKIFEAVKEQASKSGLSYGDGPKY